MDPSTDRQVWLDAYATMALIREFEEYSIQVYLRGDMPGLVHASSGQEAVPVGVCMNLSDEDYITSNHRGHGHCIAKGVDIGAMAAEILGKITGTCRGKGGSMHIADMSRNVLGANGIVAGGIAMAAGAAFTAAYLNTEQVSVVFMGDGTMNEGVTFETMNMAALWKLPVVFVCENNKFTEYTRMELLTAGTLVGRAAAFGIPAESVDGQDVEAVSAATAAAVARARAGDGPTFLEMSTYRYWGHHVGEVESGYRRAEEDEAWRRRDPLVILGDRITAKEWGDADQLSAIQRAALARVEKAYEAAQAAPDPPLEELELHVYGEVAQ